MNTPKPRDPLEEADRLVAEAFAEDEAWDRYTTALEMMREGGPLDDDMPDAEDGVTDYRNRRGE